MPINQSLKQLMWFKYTSDPRLMKRAASLRPLMAVMVATYGFAAWFLLRTAMNEPDVSWLRGHHCSGYSWLTVRPNYQFNLWDPYHDYSKVYLGPSYEIQEEWGPSDYTKKQ